MINITIQTKNHNYKAVFSEGHAEYAEAGEDIVCSAVSILLINTANAIEQFTDSFMGADSDDGVFSLILKDEPDEKAKVLMDTLVLGLKSIEEEYGEEFVKLDYKEV